MNKTVGYMKKVFAENKHHWCNDGVEKALRKLSRYKDDEPIEKLVEDGTICAEWAYNWAMHEGDKELMKKVLLKEKAYLIPWCVHVEKDNEIIEVFSQVCTPKEAVEFLAVVGHDDRVEEVVLNGDDVEAALSLARLSNKYKKKIKRVFKDKVIAKNDPALAIDWVIVIGTDKKKMREIVLKSESSYWAYMWRIATGDKSHKIKQMVLEGNNWEVLYKWALYIGDRKKIKEIIIKNKLEEIALYWLLHIGWDEALAQLIENTSDPMLAFHAERSFPGKFKKLENVVIKSKKCIWLYRWYKNIRKSERIKQAFIEYCDDCGWLSLWSIGMKDEEVSRRWKELCSE